MTSQIRVHDRRFVLDEMKFEVVEIEGEPYWFAQQLETYLEYEPMAMTRMVNRNWKDEFIDGDVVIVKGDQLRDLKALMATYDISPNTSSIMLLSETGVNTCCLLSRKPKGRQLRRWLATEVLPSIRKTGSYSSNRGIVATGDLTTLPRLLPAVKVAKELAELAGFVGNQATLVAFKAVKRAHGVDIPELMGGTNLVAEKQEQVFTPTEIGRKLNLGPQAVNKFLERLGYQSVWRQGHKAVKAWQLTDAGKEFGTYLDVGKSYSDGTPIKQIKWTEQVISKIKEFRDKDRLLRGLNSR